MADLDDAADSLLDSTTDSIIGKEEADDSVLSEIAHDSVVDDAEDPVRYSSLFCVYFNTDESIRTC